MAIRGVRLFLFLAVCMALRSGPAQSNVEWRNGDFFIGYTDIVYAGGIGLKIERVYNSKTSYKGIFGLGWGSEYETCLTTSGEGGITVHEYGGGAEVPFSPATIAQSDIDQGIQSIVRARTEAQEVTSEAERKQYETRLRADSIFRDDEWERYVQGGQIKRREIPFGTVLISHKALGQQVTSVSQGYVRRFGDGKAEFYGRDGRLTRIADSRGNFVRLAYDAASGHLTELTDNENNTIRVYWNDQGLVERVESGGKTASYQYDNLHELIYSKDADGHVYRYEYSTDRSYNMTRIAYSDGTSQDIAYFGRDKKENVRSVKERDGSLTTYDYDTDPKDENHNTVTIVEKAPDGRIRHTYHHEFRMGYTPAGREYAVSYVKVVDGERAEYTYNVLDLPTRIVTADNDIRFEYDDHGNVLVKADKSGRLEFHYDPRYNHRPVYVGSALVGGSQQAAQWRKFEYDARGALIAASDSGGNAVRLEYDAAGHLIETTFHDGTAIRFTYGTDSWPTHIHIANASGATDVPGPRSLTQLVPVPGLAGWSAYRAGRALLQPIKIMTEYEMGYSRDTMDPVSSVISNDNMGNYTYLQLLNSAYYVSESWRLETTGHPDEAVAAVREGLKADPDHRGLLVNLAHGLLLSGQLEPAKAIYLANRDRLMREDDSDSRTFRSIVQEDFEAFRKKGIDPPALKTIEALLGLAPAEPPKKLP